MCAILEPVGVTRKRNSRAAMSRSSCVQLRLHHLIEVRADDLLGPAQSSRRSTPNVTASPGGLDSGLRRLIPEAGHHHLQEGCFDPELVGLLGRPGGELPLSRLAEHDSTHLDLVDHLGDQCVVDGDLTRSRGTATCCTRRAACEWRSRRRTA